MVDRFSSNPINYFLLVGPTCCSSLSDCVVRELWKCIAGNLLIIQPERPGANVEGPQSCRSHIKHPGWLCFARTASSETTQTGTLGKLIVNQSFWWRFFANDMYLFSASWVQLLAFKKCRRSFKGQCQQCKSRFLKTNFRLSANQQIRFASYLLTPDSLWPARVKL